MALRFERIQDSGSSAVFRVTVPADRADALERLLRAAAQLAGSDAGDVQPPGDPASQEAPGAALRRLRLEQRMTQREAAGIAGTTQAQISSMEAGVRAIPLAAAERLARRFGVSPAVFLEPR